MLGKTILAIAAPATSRREDVPQERVLFDGSSPKTQSIEAVKALLTWKGRAIDPLPSKIEFTNHNEGRRMMLVLSGKKDCYYVVTSDACSCPAAVYSPGQLCKHSRKYFPQKAAAGQPEEPTEAPRRLARPPDETGSIRPKMAPFKPVSLLPSEEKAAAGAI